MKKTISLYHPFTVFIYCACIITCVLVNVHFVYSLAALIVGFAFLALCTNRQHLLSMCVYLAVMGISMVLFALLFSHEGTHTIFIFFGKAITSEQLLQALSSFFLFGAMSLWFVIAFRAIDGDYVLAKVRKASPGIALILSQSLLMVKRVLRLGSFFFVHRVSHKDSSWKSRIKHAGEGLVLLLKYCIEEALRRGESVLVRGWGIKARPTSYALYVMSFSDMFLLVLIALLVGVFVIANILQIDSCPLFDEILSHISSVGLIAWSLLLLLPLVLVLKEKII